MQPTWPKPAGSVAHRAAGGAPPVARSPLTFHGLDQSPITTSASSVPSGLGSLQGQQYPAAILAPYPASSLARSACSISWGLSATWSANAGSPGQVTGPPCSRPSSLLTHRRYSSLPPHRNWASSEILCTDSPD